jgi:hypothetical protein
MVAMAGHAADVLWSRRNPLHGPKDDDLALKQMGFRGPSFPTLLALAQGQCVENERAIRRVAAALKKGDLDRRAFLKALRKPPTPADVAAGKHFRRWRRARKSNALELAAERAEQLNKRKVSRVGARKRGARV